MRTEKAIRYVLGIRRSAALATVVFKNWDGTVLSSKTYHYGDAVAAPSDPKRPSDSRKQYVFSGWDKTVVNCVGDATYTAVYLAKSLLPDTITSSKYTVSGGVISKVSAGTKAGDTSGDNVLSITDFIQMKAHILGKSTVQPQIVRAVSTSSQTTSEPALTTLGYTQVDIIIPDRKASLAV